MKLQRRSNEIIDFKVTQAKKGIINLIVTQAIKGNNRFENSIDIIEKIDFRVILATKVNYTF